MSSELRKWGYCEFVSQDTGKLSLLVQSGKLIERCICPTGFGGLGCEIHLRQCNLKDKSCYNGMPCMISETDGEFVCDCAEADHVGKFAGMMCRNPYTEYCVSHFTPDQTTPFCTNGGKCKGSIMAAQVAPGNTDANVLFKDEGCICPRDFYGPHCEFLLFDRLEWDDESVGRSSIFAALSNLVDDKQTVLYVTLIPVFLAILCVGCVAYHRRRRLRRLLEAEDFYQGRSRKLVIKLEPDASRHDGGDSCSVPAQHDPLLVEGDGTSQAPFVCYEVEEIYLDDQLSHYPPEFVYYYCYDPPGLHISDEELYRDDTIHDNAHEIDGGTGNIDLPETGEEKQEEMHERLEAWVQKRPKKKKPKARLTKVPRPKAPRPTVQLPSVS